MLKNECTRNCWLAAAVAGLLVWIFSSGFFAGLFLGLITVFLLGNLLVWGVCQGRGGAREDAEVLGQARTPAAPDAAHAGVLERAEQAVVNASNAFAAGTVTAVEKGREAVQDWLKDDDRDDDDDHDEDRARGSRKRSDDRDDDDDDDDDDNLLNRAEDRLEQAGEAVKEAMGALAARGKQALSSLGKDRDASEDAPAVSAPVAPAADPDDAAESDRPVVAKPVSKDMPAPSKTVSPGGRAAIQATDQSTAGAAAPAAFADDDLKQIKGVGPALEAVLHENGVTLISQIAGWSETDIDHFAEAIGRMGGRIRSEDWVGQARILAAGGETEFSRRVDKGEVY